MQARKKCASAPGLDHEPGPFPRLPNPAIGREDSRQRQVRGGWLHRVLSGCGSGSLVARPCAPACVPQKGRFIMSGSDESAVPVACRFVRERNALLCAADFGPVFMELYLHLGQTNVVLADGMDEKLKTLLAALALHAAAQPRAVTCAWTVHLEDCSVNLFAVAENPAGIITGQVFAQQVRSLGGNVLHAETANADGLRRRSSVQFVGDNLLVAAERYYADSEQRAARYFELSGDSFALLVAQPDCDTSWLEGATADEVLQIWEDATPPMEVRHYSFCCGCTAQKIATAIGPALRGDLDGIFGGDSHIRVSCPRCGAKHEIARDDFSNPSRSD